MSTLKTPAFSLHNSVHRSSFNRLDTCEIIQAPCLLAVDLEKDEDIKQETESTYTEEELNAREARKTRYHS